MSNKKISMGIVEAVSATANVISTAKPVIDVAAPIVNKSVEAIGEMIEERKKLVTVPEVCNNKFPLSLEQAEKILNKKGLGVMPIELSVKDANEKYRNYFNKQVVETNPKGHQKVEPETSVLVKYITQEVIDESSRLYEENEKQKVQKKIEKKAQQEQKAKNKTKDNSEQNNKTSDILDTAKKKAKSAASHLHKQKYIKVVMDEPEETS